MPWCSCTVRVTAPLASGERVHVVGDGGFGSWRIADSIALSSSAESYPLWFTAKPVPLQIGVPCHYKFCVVADGRFSRWESVEGTRVIVPHGREMIVEDSMDIQPAPATSDFFAAAAAQNAATAAAALALTETEMADGDMFGLELGVLPPLPEEEEGSSASSSSSSSSGNSSTRSSAGPSKGKTASRGHPLPPPLVRGLSGRGVLFPAAPSTAAAEPFSPSRTGDASGIGGHVASAIVHSRADLTFGTQFAPPEGPHAAVASPAAPAPGGTPAGVLPLSSRRALRVPGIVAGAADEVGGAEAAPLSSSSATGGAGISAGGAFTSTAEPSGGGVPSSLVAEVGGVKVAVVVSPAAKTPGDPVVAAAAAVSALGGVASTASPPLPIPGPSSSPQPPMPGTRESLTDSDGLLVVQYQLPVRLERVPVLPEATAAPPSAGNGNGDGVHAKRWALDIVPLIDASFGGDTPGATMPSSSTAAAAAASSAAANAWRWVATWDEEALLAPKAHMHVAAAQLRGSPAAVAASGMASSSSSAFNVPSPAQPSTSSAAPLFPSLPTPTAAASTAGAAGTSGATFVTGLTAVRIKWIGTPPIYIPPDEEDAVTRALEPLGCIPVFMPPSVQTAYYDGFCRDTLWPMFHNVIDVYGELPTRWWIKGRQADRWKSYMDANQRFASTVVENFHEGDLVWIHDYHLLLVPMLLARRHIAPVGLFLHIPFPSSEVFRTLSVRDELLRGMLAADHIGFHLFEYARHFLTSCRRIAGLTHNAKRGGCLAVDVNGREVRVTITHVGIEPEFLLNRFAASPAIVSSAAAWRALYPGCAIIGAVDSFERLKGVPLKLAALDAFLANHPGWIGRLVLVQFATEDVMRPDENQEGSIAEIRHLAARINETYASPGRPAPVHIIIRRRVSLEERLALFAAADVFLNTAIRDGLNLAPFEYAYTRGGAECVPAGVSALSEARYRAQRGRAGSTSGSSDALTAATTDAASTGTAAAVAASAGPPALAADGSLVPLSDDDLLSGPRFDAALVSGALNNLSPGILILSEFSGCSRVMPGALRVNPFRQEEVVSALAHALSMSAEEQSNRSDSNLNYVRGNTTTRWAERVLLDLKEMSKKATNRTYMGYGLGLGYRLMGFGSSFRPLNAEHVVSAYRKAGHRLIVMDYGGTLNVRENSLMKRHAFELGLLGMDAAPPLTPETKKALKALSEDPRNTVFVISGKEKDVLQQAFSGLPHVGLAAEHGFFYRWGAPVLPKAGGSRQGLQQLQQSRSLRGDVHSSSALSIASSGLASPHGPPVLTALSALSSAAAAAAAPLPSSTAADSSSQRITGGIGGALLPTVSSESELQPLSNIGGSAVAVGGAHGAGRGLSLLAGGGGGGGADTPASVSTPMSTTGGGGAAAAAARGETASVTGASGSRASDNGQPWQSLTALANENWKALGLSIMDTYAARTNGTYILRKGSAISWHYGDADPEFGSMQAKELQDHLTGVLSVYPVDVLSGHDYVEVRPKGVNKGVVLALIMDHLEGRDRFRRHRAARAAVTTGSSAANLGVDSDETAGSAAAGRGGGQRTGRPHVTVGGEGGAAPLPPLLDFEPRMTPRVSTYAQRGTHAGEEGGGSSDSPGPVDSMSSFPSVSSSETAPAYAAGGGASSAARVVGGGSESFQMGGGAAYSSRFLQRPLEFIMTIGDDLADEEMFTTVQAYRKDRLEERRALVARHTVAAQTAAAAAAAAAATVSAADATEAAATGVRSSAASSAGGSADSDRHPSAAAAAVVSSAPRPPAPVVAPVATALLRSIDISAPSVAPVLVSPPGPPATGVLRGAKVSAAGVSLVETAAAAATGAALGDVSRGSPDPATLVNPVAYDAVVSIAAATAAASAAATAAAAPPTKGAPPAVAAASSSLPPFVYFEYTVTVGKKPSAAQYFLDDTQQVEDMMRVLAKASSKPLRGTPALSSSGGAAGGPQFALPPALAQVALHQAYAATRAQQQAAASAAAGHHVSSGGTTAPPVSVPSAMHRTGGGHRGGGRSGGSTLGGRITDHRGGGANGPIAASMLSLSSHARTAGISQPVGAVPGVARTAPQARAGVPGALANLYASTNHLAGLLSSSSGGGGGARSARASTAGGGGGGGAETSPPSSQRGLASSSSAAGGGGYFYLGPGGEGGLSALPSPPIQQQHAQARHSMAGSGEFAEDHSDDDEAHGLAHHAAPRHSPHGHGREDHDEEEEAEEEEDGGYGAGERSGRTRARRSGHPSSSSSSGGEGGADDDGCGPSSSATATAAESDDHLAPLYANAGSTLFAGSTLAFTTNIPMMASQAALHSVGGQQAQAQRERAARAAAAAAAPGTAVAAAAATTPPGSSGPTTSSPPPQSLPVYFAANSGFPSGSFMLSIPMGGSTRQTSVESKGSTGGVVTSTSASTARLTGGAGSLSAPSETSASPPTVAAAQQQQHVFVGVVPGVPAWPPQQQQQQFQLQQSASLTSSPPAGTAFGAGRLRVEAGGVGGVVPTPVPGFISVAPAQQQQPAVPPGVSPTTPSSMFSGGLQQYLLSIAAANDDNVEF